MTTRMREDAMRLLRVMNERQARNREGAEVVRKHGGVMITSVDADLCP
jgi:hypothetical protein